MFRRVDKYLGEDLIRFAIANAGDFVEGAEPGIKGGFNRKPIRKISKYPLKKAQSKPRLLLP